MKNKWLPYVLILTVLGCAYGVTLAPGLSWANGGADGGDLITAAAVNGVPHPTGYPLYMLAARIFQLAIPFGDLAFRTNLLSAACTIATALLVYQTVMHVLSDQQRSPLAGLAAALSFGLAQLIWSQAVIAEVYALQSLLTIAIVYQTLTASGRLHGNLMRGLLLGLALGNHITTIFLLPFLLTDGQRLRVGAPFLQLLLRAVGLMAGMAVYMVLPMRAALQPPINWFNPVGLDGLWQLVTGRLYQSYFSTDYVFARMRAWVGYLIKNFSFLGVAVGLFGMFEFHKRLTINVMLAWIFGSYGLFALLYASYDADVYLIQSMLAFCVWIGMGFSQLLEVANEKWRNAERVATVLMLLFFGLHVPSILPLVDASQDTRAIEFAEIVQDSVPEGALLFTNDDLTTFALWYFHYALGQRVDTAVIAQGLLPYDWYRESLRVNYPQMDIPETPNLSPFLLIQNNPRRPFCFVQYKDQTDIKCSTD